MIIDQNPTNFDNIIMRIAPNSAASVLRDASKVWSEVAPDRPFDFSFVDDQFASQFGTDEIIRTLLGILGAFSMLIGVVGLFALTSLSVELRKGEMAIRKSLGASSQSIFGLLASDSVKLIGFALLAAIPVTLVLISRWLESFPFVAPLSPISFLMVGIGTIVLALLSISFNLIKVAVRPVIETIRNSE
ncbi:MAG: hypothetical protein O3B41_08040 [Bacteroidetes bacterium]|nr:hypothetical protein [Bacteroidota bacterium]